MAAIGGRCDFARDVAFLYPLHVIMEVLGVPEADEPRMLQPDAGTVRRGRPRSEPHPARNGSTRTSALASLQETVADFYSYFKR